MRRLKKCPFCGGTATVEKLGWPHHVYCMDCGAKVTSTLTGKIGEEDAIRKWNTRRKDG